MSRAGRKTKRFKSATKAHAVDSGAVFIQLLKNRLMSPDSRTHSQFLADMRAKQSAGQLENPAVTGPLLDRFERSIR